MTTASKLDLTALIRAHVETSDDLDPRVIAQAVIEDLPDELLREALHLVLPDRVRRFHGNVRTGHERALSARWGAVRDNADALAVFRRAVCLGPTDWRPLGSLVHDQVLIVVAERRAQARATDAQAARYEELAALMKRRRAKVVSDLPPEQVVEVLG